MTNWIGSSHRVVMIVLNDVAHDNRVLKTARLVMSTGADVTVFGVSKDREVVKPLKARFGGVRVRLFPHPRFARLNSPSQKINYLANQHSLLSSFLAAAVKLDPTMLYTHDYNTLKIGGEMSAWLRRSGANLSWVHDLHEYVAGLTTIDDDVRRLALTEEAAFIHAPDHLVTVSPPLAIALQRDYGLRRRPSVVLNSNPLTCMALRKRPPLRRELGLDRSVPLAVYTGGVAAARGLHTLLAAMPLVPELHVAIVTNNVGTYVDSLTALARDGGFEDRLHWRPYVPPEEVPAYIRDVTFGVHPMVHFENAEVALPNKLFDYCLAQVPCVVSDCRAMGDFVRRWGIGEVFPAESAKGLANAITRVIRRRPVYVRALKADGGLVARFSWERQCEILADILSTVAGPWSQPDLGEQDVQPADETVPDAAALPAPSPQEADGAVSAPAASDLIVPDLVGSVTEVAADRIVGWVLDRADSPVTPQIDLFHGDDLIGTALAGGRKPVLDGGEERNGWRFEVELPARYLDARPRRLVLRVQPGGRLIDGSPGLFVLGREPSWIPEAQLGAIVPRAEQAPA